MTAQRPSFSRMWSEPVPKLSSPQIDKRPASIKLPKNFHPVEAGLKERQKSVSQDHHVQASTPVGTSNTSKPFAFATRSIAPLVGIDLASPLTPLLK